MYQPACRDTMYNVVLRNFMQKIINLLTIIVPVLIVLSLAMGCTNIESSLLKQKSETTYFHKGVYKSFSPDKTNSYKNYFYVFYDENSGHTEESERGIGLPFSCEQKYGYVKFRFGGIQESEETFIIESAEKDVITGFFENGSLVIFSTIKNVNPDNFDAVKYMNRK